MQPFYHNDGKGSEWYLVCNGEIYNADELREEYKEVMYEVESSSDCAVLLPLFVVLGFFEAVPLLRGEFAMVVVHVTTKGDEQDVIVMAARDTLGVRPLFYNEELMVFASEAKGIPPSAATRPFPAGCTYIHFDEFGIVEQLPVRKMMEEVPKKVLVDYEKNKEMVRKYVEKAVERRVPRDKDVEVFGCLLSGGVDSSIVTALAAKYAKKHGKRIEAFTVCIDGESPDLHYAKKCAEHIGVKLNEVRVSMEEVYAAIEDCVETIESYDTTTVRASLMQYMAGKFIRARGDIKVVLCGEVSDELFQGYLYFHKQPTVQKGAEESRRLLRDIYLFDGLRTDRTMARWGLEVRLPFSDDDLLKRVLLINPYQLCPLRDPAHHTRDVLIEKFLLRDAFEGLIPRDILWRRKDAFSDAVSSVRKSLFEYLQEHIRDTHQMEETEYYRAVFDRRYNRELVPYLWMPKWSNTNDPSARTLDYYEEKE